jgi:tRNA 2-thiouridine synthesizing protein A
MTVHSIDAAGLHCPWPVLKLQKALATLNTDETIELIATDPLARIDVPHYCQQSGHRLLGEEERLVGDETVWVFTIQHQ